MSRFDDLDHRLGRHEGSPNMDCSLCNPALAVKIPDLVINGIHTGLGAPAFPAWGDLWQHRGGLFAFVNSGSENPNHAGGFWADTSTSVTDHTKPILGTLLQALPFQEQGIQLELGSGKWAIHVEVLMTQQSVPNEHMLRSPVLGVDVRKAAEDRNRAHLIVMLNRKGMFPVSEITLKEESLPLTNTMRLGASLYTVRIPVSGPPGPVI